jgi:hypothetical protein
MNMKEVKKKEAEKGSLFKKLKLLRIVIVNNHYKKQGIFNHEIVSENVLEV